MVEVARIIGYRFS